MKDNKTILIAGAVVMVLIIVILLVSVMSAKNQLQIEQQQIATLQTKNNTQNTNLATGTNKATALNSVVTGVKDLAPLLLLL